MKTDDLISLLSTGVEPVERGRVTRTITLVIGASAVLAVVAMLGSHGLRENLLDSHVVGYILIKILFTVGILVPAIIYLMRLARPGGRQRTSTFVVVLQFLALVLLAVISLCLAPAAHWKGMVLGRQWLECLVSIPLIAIVPFAALVWVVRKMAPTDLTRAGALIGLTAGAVSATGYALHCVDDSVPFIAAWYGGTIALCTLAGAMLGPRLLRW